jgi:hypothetical protein
MSYYYVRVASIAHDWQIASQIESVLRKAGIDDFCVSGPGRLDIEVPTDKQEEVTRLLKQDAHIHNYEIKFY